MARVLVAHGPNLSRLGSREPEVYGTATLADIEATLRGRAVASLELSFAQTDDEATLVGLMHDAVDSGTHVIVNPAAFTHYSYALRDACAMVTWVCLSPTLLIGGRRFWPPCKRIKRRGVAS